MRVIYDAWGQMGNRFWEYVDQVAWAMVHNEKVISLFWDPSLDDFDNLRTNPYIKFPLYVKCLQKGVVGRIYRHILYKTLHNKPIQSLFASPIFKKMGFLSGKDLLFGCDKYYHEVWETEKELFSPNKKISNRIDNEFANKRANSESMIVGVHLRKGDYRTFHNGFFYYDDSEYAHFMQQILNIFGKNTIFFLASNEKIDKSLFSDFRIFELQNTSAVEDFYSLSKCDYIMGPFSTFCCWASFWGNVPCYVFKRNGKISYSDFSVVHTLKRPLGM